MADAAWTEERFQRVSRFWADRLVLESAALDVYGELAQGPLGVGELARRLQLDERATRLFLDALTALGLVRKEGERYANSQAATRYLVPEGPDYLGHELIAARDTWALWARLPDTLRSGRAGWERNIFSDEPERARHLLLAIHRRARPHARALLQRGMLDPSRYRTMLDLGGGAGTYAIAFCRANPDLQATLVDLPAATELADRQVREAGLADRIRVLTRDFEADEIPGRYDLVWTSNIIHSRDPEANRALIERVHGHVEPGGELAIHDLVMSEDRTRPARGAVFALHMLLANGVGRCYTFSEIRDWLHQAGFGQVRRVADHDDHELVMGVRV